MSETPPTPPKSVWKRFGPLAVLVAGLLAFWVFDLGRFVSFEGLRAHREALTDWVAARPISGGVVAAIGYALVVAFSLPVASLMTLVVGFLFGQIWGMRIQQEVRIARCTVQGPYRAKTRIKS